MRSTWRWVVLLLTLLSSGCHTLPVWHDEVLRSGARAPATVMGVEKVVEHHSNHTNEPLCRVDLRVEPPGAPPFRATALREIGPLEAPYFKVGEQVMVRYDTVDRRRVALEDPGAEAAGSGRPTSVEEAERQLLAAQALFERLNQPGAGIATAAIVYAFEPWSVAVNQRAVVATVRVKVLHPDGRRFDASILAAFNDEGLHKYQPGQEVSVVFDPEDLAQVAFDDSRTTILRSDPAAE